MDSLQKINLEASINLDDIVNVFISKHETALHDRQQVLRTQYQELLTTINRKADQICKEKKDEYKKYLVQAPEIKFYSKLGKVELNRDKTDVEIEVHFGDTPSVDRSWSADRRIKIELPTEQQLFFEQKQEELKDLQKDLEEVQEELADVSRKERQVRGLISSRKLTEAGMDELLQDTEIINVLKLTE